ADATDVSALPAPALLMLAHLLEGCSMPDDALRLYRRFLMRNPQAVEFAPTALQAGRLATREQAPDQAIWFLERALTAGTLSAEDRQQAEEFLETARADLASIPQVIVVEESPAPAAPAIAPAQEVVPIALEPSPSPDNTPIPVPLASVADPHS